MPDEQADYLSPDELLDIARRARAMRVAPPGDTDWDARCCRLADAAVQLWYEIAPQ